MKLLGTRLRLSASDLANHLGCRHLSNLNRLVATGSLNAPSWFDPSLQVMQQRGLEHERQYLEHLKSGGLEVVAVENVADDAAVERTREAMQSGAEVIAQGALASACGRWFGRADVLRKVPRPSKLGTWSYEAYDTKLARETRAGALLQLCLYSDLLSEVQGELPERMHVVPPGVGFEPDSHRVQDYLAYYRWVARHLVQAMDAPVAADALPTYPEPNEHCETCRWNRDCEAKRRADDHLSLVAGASRSQRRELVDHNIARLAAMAQLPLPISWRPKRGSVEGLTKIREQARVQYEGRASGEPVYELLPSEIGRGLALLPEPSAGDIFFDIEGDPFALTDGLEYLFGYVCLGEDGAPKYTGEWALDRASEKGVFEEFVDFVMKQWAAHPTMHVYHYAPYEPSVVRRLMGRHDTREHEVDRILRAELFVDLFAVVRQGVRAGVESYSIKSLEVFFDFQRSVPLPEAGAARRAVERFLELGGKEVPAEVLQRVAGYNRDDCVSALQLRNWLEDLRRELIASGRAIERRKLQSGDPSEAQEQMQEALRALKERLVADLPSEGRNPEQQGRWLLAHMLDWHWREGKVARWEFYRLRRLSDEDLLEEREALAGLTFVETVEEARGCATDRYRFPPQETDLDEDDEVYLLEPHEEKCIGSVKTIDVAAGTLEIKKTRAAKEIHPKAIFTYFKPQTRFLAGSIERLATWVADHGIDGPGDYRAARDLLLRQPPRFVPGWGEMLVKGGESFEQAARRRALELDCGVLPIQGPPGTGKTYVGARMICELVKNGRKVGVTAVSHKVIRNLLEEVVNAARLEKLTLCCGHKIKTGEEPKEGPIADFVKGGPALAALAEGSIQVLGGTAWLWAPVTGVVDVLVVDEAGQLSLVDALAAAPAARSIVLLGDPRQLQQPQQGTQPEGTELSALEHLLGDRLTVPPDRGLFLEETHRLHASICRHTSELFYESRLRTLRHGNQHTLVGPSRFEGAGLWYVPVEHEGNQSVAPEEVETVAQLAAMLTSQGIRWVDEKNRELPLTHGEIMIVAPYNAQVAELSARLPDYHIGTVDRFQGQQAPVVIISMTSSSVEDAPRGMEFLYSPNRFNVATSRAKCACIVVASPRLFEPECRTVRQMVLANAFCRYRELSREFIFGKIDER